MPSAFFPLIFILPSLVIAANDWSKPCLSGSCSYDLHNSTSPHGVSGGSIYINGSTNAISDLTEAAGWTILGCDANAGAQNITAICTGDNNDCSHLYNNGAVGTLVRLPENCSKFIFARIASEWKHENQTIPDNVAQKLRRRYGAINATVRGISLDTQFSKIDPNHHGHVSMFLQGATGAAANTAATSAIPSTRDLWERGLFSSISSAVHKAVQTIEQSFNDNKSGSTPINVDKTINVFSKTEQCTVGPLSVSAGIKVNVEAKADATLNYGLALQGTIVPPKISEFALVAGLDATLDGILSADLSASATLSSGQITIFSVGLPGLDFPDILTIGPTFSVTTQAIAKVEADASLSVDLSYTASGAKLYFPPSAGSSLGTFAPGNTNIQLSANPGVSASGSLTAHVVPTIAFGINALDGLADVSVNLNVDAQADLSVSLSKSVNTAFNGCADISTGLSVNAAANGDFFGLFNPNEKVTLYSHNWDLWKKCWGAQRREHTRAFPSFPKRDGITCPASATSSSSRQPMTSATVPGSTISGGQTSSA